LGGILQRIADLFTGRGFEPHGECYVWTPGIIALHVASDALIALAYYSIPVLLVFFLRRRTDIPFSGVVWMFVIFIVACGTTHVLAIWEIWHGAYWLSGIVKAITAVASVGTAILMIPIIPRALRFKSPAELDRINRQLSASLDEKEHVVQMYRREHQVASALQSALLPESLPDLPGLVFDATYRADRSESEIGGDWYDALARPDGTIFLSIGDVAGSGLPAAVTMGKVRQSLRTLALQSGEPTEILTAGETVLMTEPGPTVVTAWVGVFDPATHVMRYSAAGHPHPLLRRPDGSIEELSGSSGPPLGAWEVTRVRPRSMSVVLEPGALLCLYTDGLIEATRDVGAGLDALQAALADAAVREAPSVAEAIAKAVLPDRPGPRDDVAVLTLAVKQAAETDLDVVLTASPNNARVARHAVRAFLNAQADVPDERRSEIELAVGEAVANAIEHAYGRRRGAFRLHAQCRDGRLVIEVTDQGRWREPRANGGRGRGLAIMRRVSDDLAVRSGDDGSAVALTFALSPVDR
jgi:serine phosphatase RsbU (regulator of sigma subunit)/anti-sigma regulatory factor (Ser/Thr protein kinase)